MEVSFNFRNLNRALNDGTPREKFVYKADETHFLMDKNDGRKCAMKLANDIKFADVMSDDHGITMMDMLGGCLNYRICVPFMIFKKLACSYPIRTILDTVRGV